jgi:hypothetical protein
MLRRYHLFQPLPAAACDKADRKIAGLIISNLPEAGVRRNVPGGNLHLPISRFRRTLQNLEKPRYGEDGLLRFVSKHDTSAFPPHKQNALQEIAASGRRYVRYWHEAGINSGAKRVRSWAKADMSDAVT